MTALLATLFALPLALSSLAEPGEPLDVASPHRWRIVHETSEVSFAVMADVPSDASVERDVWLMMTVSDAYRLREGGAVRQVYALLGADCAARTKRNILIEDAFAGEPPRAYAPPPEGTYSSDNLPPLPIVVTPRPYQPVDPTSPFGRAVAVVCGDAAAAYPAVEGDWATVMGLLLARQDARAPAS